MRPKISQLPPDRLLAAIIESSDDAIISKSLEGIIRTWNAAAERLFGHTAEQAIGRHISIVIPPERIAEEDQIIASLKAGRRIEHFETVRRRRDGQHIEVSLTVSPIRDDDGNVVGASKIVRDITERRRAESERDKLADTQRRLAADLSAADRRKDEFLAMLAHELRTPLAPIVNAVQALRLAGSRPDAVAAALPILERQSAHMSRLVDDLFDVSRVTRGRIELRRRPTALAAVVEQAVEAVRALYADMHHELTVTLPPVPILLSADAARLAQVIGNLLNNACKFTGAGGRIFLTVEREGEEAIIRVRDEGIGIAADQIPRMFEMFAQADTSLERSRQGLGIGLTLVKTIVEMHAGTVEARSEGTGRGSEFIVRLPMLAEAVEPIADTGPADTARVASRRILIVDDNEDNAESLSMLLEEDGHETHQARDGVQAIEAAERVRPDAVLLDIGLPKLNGYEVCRLIRAQPWGKSVMMVALTGWGQDEDRLRSKAAGFDVHLVKPIDHDQLMQVLARASIS